ncbi:hypothetical protein allfine_87 [Escherichia phage allfine]|uniref:Uncharacterized protein n=1 Tax=Escherichia phage allfine TaxID=2696380 RepID=A0A6B9XBL2_9CAUD|nr:hypothetical protein allfine_87 [Escherichia phage allfine]
MKIKEMNINIVLEERWENIKKPEDGKKFLSKILVAAKEELTGKIAAAITIKICVKGLPQHHQFALDEFKESFYNPNKQMLESNFAVSTSIVHDRSFILYKNMRGESCKHIG